MLGKLFPCKAKGSAKGEEMEECKWREQTILLVVRLENPLSVNMYTCVQHYVIPVNAQELLSVLHV